MNRTENFLRINTSLFKRKEIRLFVDNLESKILLNDMIKVNNYIRINRHIKTDQTSNIDSSDVFKKIENNIESFRSFLIFKIQNYIIKI